MWWTKVTDLPHHLLFSVVFFVSPLFQLLWTEVWMRSEDFESTCLWKVIKAKKKSWLFVKFGGVPNTHLLLNIYKNNTLCFLLRCGLDLEVVFHVCVFFFFFFLCKHLGGQRLLFMNSSCSLLTFQPLYQSCASREQYTGPINFTFQQLFH